jgi:hypothetical protein
MDYQEGDFYQINKKRTKNSNPIAKTLHALTNVVVILDPH